MSTQISIIIPCYNSEATLEDTLKSVMDQDCHHWEVIIINDGSTDATEEIALKWVDHDNRFRYFSKENEGLGKARNYGIERAKGIYILPLDSDNLVEKSFVAEAISVLESNEKIGVVHGHAEFFGEKKGNWYIKSFDLESIMVDNYIDACAIFRKETWCIVGGYDENMPYQGFEDWEFWIALGTHKVQFYHLDKVTFKYFVQSTSMVRSFTKEMAISNRDYIVKKHSKLYFDKYVEKYSEVALHQKQLQSKKFILNNFTKRFLGFTFFKY